MEDSIDQSVNQLISDVAVYRTAPATPGLLNICIGLGLKIQLTKLKLKIQLYLTVLSLTNQIYYAFLDQTHYTVVFWT